MVGVYIVIEIFGKILFFDMTVWIKSLHSFSVITLFFFAYHKKSKVVKYVIFSVRQYSFVSFKLLLAKTLLWNLQYAKQADSPVPFVLLSRANSFIMLESGFQGIICIFFRSRIWLSICAFVDESLDNSLSYTILNMTYLYWGRILGKILKQFPFIKWIITSESNLHYS